MRNRPLFRARRFLWIDWKEGQPRLRETVLVTGSKKWLVKMAGIASFASRAVERIEASEPRHARMIGDVVIFGLDQLEPAAAGEPPHFIDRWQAAMSFQLGAEEFEKFCAGRKHRSV